MSIERFSNYIVIDENYSAVIDMGMLKEQHLRLDDLDASDDAYIEMLAVAAIQFCEDYTKREVAFRQYKTFLDGFIKYEHYQIRKCPLKEVYSLSYLVDGQSVTIPSEAYYTTESTSFSLICPIDGWPQDYDDRLQCVTLEFSTGYSTLAEVPKMLTAGIYAHIANMYFNRGDCSKASCQQYLPPQSRAIYEMNRINDLRIK